MIGFVLLPIEKEGRELQLRDATDDLSLNAGRCSVASIGCDGARSCVDEDVGDVADATGEMTRVDDSIALDGIWSPHFSSSLFILFVVPPASAPTDVAMCCFQ